MVVGDERASSEHPEQRVKPYEKRYLGARQCISRRPLQWLFCESSEMAGGL